MTGASCVLFSSLMAGEVASEPGHHGAHLHGVAQMTLAAEGRELEIQFTAPAVSVVGFEHRAVSRNEVDAVVAARDELRNGAAMFTFTGARCEQQHAEVDVSAVWEEAETGHDEHHDERHAEKASHDDDGAHEHHEAHGHDNSHDRDEQHEETETHSDIVASYSFRCDRDGGPQAVRVGERGLPFGIETINVMWLSDNAQGATELTASMRDIEFQ